MRQFTIGILGSAAIVAISIYLSDSSGFLAGRALAFPIPFYTMDELNVVVPPPRFAATPYTMWGTFRIRRAAHNEPGVPKESLGGACLLAQIPNGKSCSRSNECGIRVPSPFGGVQWDGYCLRDPGSLGGDLATNSCWVKPGEGYCLKGVGVGTHSTPTVNTKTVYAQAAKYPSAHGKPLKWMVYGCLNGPMDPGKRPCADGSGHPMHFKGKIREVGRVK